MYFSLSWRNLWRDKKRTIIAAASVFFAVLLAVLMRSGQRGSYAFMVDSASKIYTGHLQIQGDGYWEKRSIDRSIVLEKSTIDSLGALPHLSTVSPRLESFALVSKDVNTRVTQIIGIDPAAENAMSGLRQKIVGGKYLNAMNSQNVLVAGGLADILGTKVGDTIVVYGQGYHGLTAAAQYRVGGIVKLPFPALNNGTLYMSLSNAQDLFSAYGRLTSAAIMADNVRDLPAVRKSVRDMIGQEYTLMTWDEMMPDLVQGIELDNAGGLIMLLILYIVIAFGVFGTVMMMTAERSKEFGILVSIGMNKKKLMLVTTLESVQMSLLGAFAGFLASIPMIFYLHANPIHMTGEAAKAYEAFGVEPIMNFSVDPQIFFSQTVLVLLIALATAVYPILFIGRLKPARALHG